jgi:hypothetical protein
MVKRERKVVVPEGCFKKLRGTDPDWLGELLVVGGWWLVAMRSQNTSARIKIKLHCDKI